MTTALLIVLAVIAVALIFEYINGFHDTANSIATVVATKVLTPRQAVVLAAGMNLLGALAGTAVAKTISSGLIDTNVVAVGSGVLICALTGGIIWNLITWWLGLPSSSSHALVGGLCGAAVAAAHGDFGALIWSQTAGDWTQNKGILWKVVMPMISSPVAGFTLGILIMGTFMAVISTMNGAGGWMARVSRPRWVNAIFGKAQIASAAYMGFAHGTNDAQKTMGIIALAIFGAEASGTLNDLPTWLSFLHPNGQEGDIDTWIVFACAIVHFGMPVSTTHSISTAIMGVGFAKNPKALKWTIIERIVWAWILTIPAAGGLAYGMVLIGRSLGWIG